MSRKIGVISVFCSSLLLTACDSESIKEVKEVVNFNLDSSLTLGKAFETRSDCHDGVWSENKDNRGRVIVSYTCILSEQGLSYINADLVDRLNSSVATSNGIIESNIKSIDNNIRSKNDELESLDRLNSLLSKAANDLHENFLNGKAEYLSYRSYLQELLNFAHKGKDYFDVSKLCTDFYGHYAGDDALDMERAQAAGADISNFSTSCNKYIYPIFADFIERNFATPSYVNYDFTQELSYLPSDRSLSDEDVLKKINVKTNEYKNKLNNSLSFLPNERNRLTENFAHNLNLQKVSAPELSVINMKIQHRWIVSDTGGVENIDGIYTVDTGKENITSSVSGDALMPFAYHDYKENEIPIAYKKSAENMMGNIYLNIVGQLKSI